MAVPAGPTEKRYTGNGVTTIYTIPFLLLAASDLDVFLDGVEIVSGFTITGVGNPTSTITFTTAPPSLSSILLNLNVPFERLNDYQENGDFLSSTVNRDFDRIWQALKQLLRVSTRSLTLGFFDVDGAGAYRAKGNRIADLADPVGQQDAATKNWVGLLLDGVSGLVNTTVGIAYDAGTLFDYLRFGVSRSVDSITALKALSPSRNQRATVENDKFVSRYRFDSTSVATPDDATVVMPSSGSGRWLINHDGSMSLYQWGVVGDKVTDDTARVQAATNWASTGAYELVVPSWLGARLTAPILVSGSVRLRGEHIQISKTVASLGVNDTGKGAWFFIDHLGIGFSFNEGGIVVTRPRLDMIGTYRNQPVPVTGLPYVPLAADFDFRFYNCDSVTRDIVLWNSSKGIQITCTPASSQSRGDMSGIYGNPLMVGIQVDFIADVLRLDNIHFWPYFSSNVEVINYMAARSVGMVLKRCDDPFITRFFTYGYRFGFSTESYLTYGSVSKGKMTNFDFDSFGQCGIYINGTGGGFSFSNGSGQGQNTTVAQNFLEFSAGSSGNNMSISQVDAGFCANSVIRVGGLSNNVLKVGAGMRLYNWNGSGIGFPAIAVTSNNQVVLEAIPEFTAPLNSGTALDNDGTVKGSAILNTQTLTTDSAGLVQVNSGLGRTPRRLIASVTNTSTALIAQQTFVPGQLKIFVSSTGAALVSSGVTLSAVVVFE